MTKIIQNYETYNMGRKVSLQSNPSEGLNAKKENINKASLELIDTFYDSQDIPGLVNNIKDIDLDALSFLDEESQSIFNLHEEVSLKNKYWLMMKNHLHITYTVTKKVIKKNTKGKAQTKKQKKKEEVKVEVKEPGPKMHLINTVNLPETDWYNKKYEREVGKAFVTKFTDFDKVDRALKRRVLLKKCEVETCLYTKYKEKPRPANIPDVAWHGPKMKYCRYPVGECECKGNMTLPSAYIPFAIRYNWTPFWFLRLLFCFKFFNPRAPDKNFAKRLVENLEAEEAAYRTLYQKGVLKKSGSEFCPYRCVHYCGSKRTSNPYFSVKRQIKLAFLENKPMPTIAGPVEIEETEEKEEAPPEATYYRTVFTEAYTDENGEFIIGPASHILYGKYNVLCDLEGKGLNVSFTMFPEDKAPQTIVKKLEKLVSVQRFKKRLSQLTSNLFSSIIQIEDPGVPVNTRATQDPPLNDNYESIIEINKQDTLNYESEDICPCCEWYKKSLPNFIPSSDAEITPDSDNWISKLNKEFENLSQHDKSETNQNKNETGDDVSKLANEKPQNLSPKLKSEVSNNIENKDLGISDDKKLLSNSVSPTIQPKTSTETEPKKEKMNLETSLKEDTILNDEQLKSAQLSDKNNSDIIPNKNERQRIEHKENMKSCCSKYIDPPPKSPSEGMEIQPKIEEPEASLTDKIDDIIEKSQNEPISPDEQPKKRKKVERENPALIKEMSDKFHKLSSFIKTQKSSFQTVASKKLEELRLKAKERNIRSFDDIKIKIKQSFEKTSNALTSFIKSLHKKSTTVINQNFNKEKDDRSSEGAIKMINNCQSKTGKQECATSEKEVFSLQYTSTLTTNMEKRDINDADAVSVTDITEFVKKKSSS